MTHQFKQLPIDGAFIIEPGIFRDERGYFFESYHRGKFIEGGITDTFVQDNEARSSAGVLRGLHYQVEPFAQSKLIRTIKGAIFDVLVDLRADSPTFGKWYGAILSDENKLQLYIPRGFAHGYLALRDDTIISYKCDNLYSRDHEGGIRYDDPTLDIQWPAPGGSLIVSEKDRNLPNFGKHRTE